MSISSGLCSSLLFVTLIVNSWSHWFFLVVMSGKDHVGLVVIVTHLSVPMWCVQWDMYCLTQVNNLQHTTVFLYICYPVSCQPSTDARAIDSLKRLLGYRKTVNPLFISPWYDFPMSKVHLLFTAALSPFSSHTSKLFPISTNWNSNHNILFYPWIFQYKKIWNQINKCIYIIYSPNVNNETCI
jgi:hypothetical protein